ncbi:6060_t:CDS:2, partial [Acaulospora colombiana]
AVQECVSEFISFITAEAAEKCHDEKRKTIGGEDVLYAMMLLGLEQYVEPLKIYLAKMRMPTNATANGTDVDLQIEEEQKEAGYS